MLRKLISLTSLALTLSLSSCGGAGGIENTNPSGASVNGNSTGASTSTPSEDVKEIASNASKNVGVVGRTASGSKGAKVMVLEELHNSRAGQIQQAIALVRLHDNYALKDIGLEGYVQERGPINTSWFNKIRPGKENLIARASVAVRLLKEGEISAGEFMNLVYEDITLHAVEKESEYDVELAPDAVNALIAYLSKLKSSRAAAIVRRYGDPNAIKSIPSEEHLAMAREIESLATQESVVLPPGLKKGWQSWVSFWQGRDDSNKTMIDAVSKISSFQTGNILAMCIGTAHTKKICDLLAGAGGIFAVITPLNTSKGDTRGDLGEEAFKRKTQTKSVFTQGELASILAELKKPEPVSQEKVSWFKLDASWRLLTDKIAERAAAGGSPPYNFTRDDLSNEYVSVDPAQITIIPDSDDRKNIKCILFPITVKGKKDQLWVKALSSEDGSLISNVPKREERTVEMMLKSTLNEVQEESQSPKQAEDGGGRIRIGSNTIASIGKLKENLTRTRLISGV